MDKIKIIENHKGSLRKLFQIYNTKGDLAKGYMLWVSINIDIALSIFIDTSGTSTYKLICDFTEIYTSILPNLLGFNLGAYALLIGLASSELLKKMSASYESKFTSFQRASSVFGFCVFLQAIALIFAFLVKTVLAINDHIEHYIYSFPSQLIDAINFSCLFVLNLLGIYAILILVSVIQSTFAISQAAHFYSVTEHIKSEESEIRKSRTKKNRILSFKNKRIVFKRISKI